MHDKARLSVEPDQHDDVSGLFRRLGNSHEAGGYRDFTPVELPNSAAPLVVLQGIDQAPAEPVLQPASAVRQLRPAEHAVAVAGVPAATKSATALDQLFQRLLQDEVPVASGGLLKRFFVR